jgi:hypothetical protein
VHAVVPVETDRGLVDALDDVALGHLRQATDTQAPEPTQARARAEQALSATVEALRGAGLDADGELAADDPVADVLAAARRLDADEVVVVTEPHLIEETLRRDWASRVRHDLDRPVLHVVAGTDRVVS